MSPLPKLSKENRRHATLMAKWYSASVMAEAIVRATRTPYGSPYEFLNLIQDQRTLREEKRLTTKLANLRKRHASCRSPYRKLRSKLQHEIFMTEFRQKLAVKNADRARERIAEQEPPPA